MSSKTRRITLSQQAPKTMNVYAKFESIGLVQINSLPWTLYLYIEYIR